MVKNNRFTKCDNNVNFKTPCRGSNTSSVNFKEPPLLLFSTKENNEKKRWAVNNYGSPTTLYRWTLGKRPPHTTVKRAVWVYRLCKTNAEKIRERFRVSFTGRTIELGDKLCYCSLNRRCPKRLPRCAFQQGGDSWDWMWGGVLLFMSC